MTSSLTVAVLLPACCNKWEICTESATCQTASFAFLSRKQDLTCLLSIFGVSGSLSRGFWQWYNIHQATPSRMQYLFFQGLQGISPPCLCLLRHRCENHRWVLRPDSFARTITYRRERLQSPSICLRYLVHPIYRPRTGRDLYPSCSPFETGQ